MNRDPIYAVAYRPHLRSGETNLRHKTAIDPHHRIFARAENEARVLERVGGWARGDAVIMVWTNSRWRPLANAKLECPT